MKIAYLSYGESIHDHRFLSKMVEHGHEPILISYFGNKLVQVDGVKTYKFNFRDIYGLRRYLPISFLKYRTQKRLYSHLIARHLRSFLKDIDADILHTNFIHYEGYCGALTGFQPTVSMPWGTDIIINPEKSQFDKYAAKYTLNKAQKIVCDCDLVRDKIIKMTGCSPEKIKIVYCGVDRSLFRPAVAGNLIREQLGLNNRKVLMMNRSFEPVYGIRYFIDALPAILKVVPETYVILAGDGTERTYIEKRVESLGLNNHVHFTGCLNEGEMANYLNASDVYISTSLSDGTSVSLMEALCCGLPVVVSDIPANREWVEDGGNGILVGGGDVQSIANGVTKLIMNPDMMKRFSERNLSIAEERADWDKNYGVLERVYEEMLNQ